MFSFEDGIDLFVNARPQGVNVFGGEWGEAPEEVWKLPPLRIVSIRKWRDYRGSTLGRDVVERLARDTHYRKQMRTYVRGLDPAIRGSTDGRRRRGKGRGSTV